MTLNPEVKDLFDFTFEDFTLSEYDPHPHIKARVSVWEAPLAMVVAMTPDT